MKYYLVGYMYSGKSTVGPQLAKRAGLGFVDLDQAFECRYHVSVPDFFARYGEEAFRTLEQQLLFATADLNNAVIATGGGTACQPGNMDFINSQGLSIFLQMPLDSILRRAAASHKERPLITAMPPEERRRHIGEQLQQRLPYYRKAQLIVDADTNDINTIIDRILSACPQD